MKSFVFASCISSLLLLATAPAGAAAPLSLRCTLDAGHEDWGERHEYNFDELGLKEAYEGRSARWRAPIAPQWQC